jgi:hypothetical protein
MKRKYHTVGTVLKSNKKYHTVGTVLKSNRKIIKRDKIDTSNTNTGPLILLAFGSDFNTKKNDKTYPVFTSTSKNTEAVVY